MEETRAFPPTCCKRCMAEGQRTKPKGGKRVERKLTGLDMHSCSFLALSLQALAPTRSPALAQQPSMAVSSRAQA